MKLEALDHPKTLDFAARLNVELPTAIGYLELLWAFTGKKAPQGDIGKWPDGAIARACYYNGNPITFIAALVDAGFIDLHDSQRYVVHDWKDHAPRWVLSKLSRAKLAIYDCSADYSGDCSDYCIQNSSGDSVSEVKGRQGKTSEVTHAHTPDGLDPTAWQSWVDYRNEIRKPLKPASIQAAQQALAAFGCDQVAVVQQSIANGYQGLFALKNGSNGNAKTQHTGKPSVAEQATAAREEWERKHATG